MIASRLIGLPIALFTLNGMSPPIPDPNFDLLVRCRMVQPIGKSYVLRFKVLADREGSHDWIFESADPLTGAKVGRSSEKANWGNFEPTLYISRPGQRYIYALYPDSDSSGTPSTRSAFLKLSNTTSPSGTSTLSAGYCSVVMTEGQNR